MWSDTNSGNRNPRTVFYTPPPISFSRTPVKSKTWTSEKKQNINPNNLFHAIHKVPHGESPYVKAKHVQMVEKDPGKAVSLFWNAINSGDRVDSALKDMAAVMKQLNRPDEAIEAIRSFRHLCPPDSQESIDNVLVELYKRSGRLEEEIEVLLLKLKRIEEVNCFGKSLRMGRSQGKRIPVRPQQEYARLLGNLAWAYLQLNEYRTAEEYYRKALSIEPDRNKQCNLAICLMCMNNITEAKFLLQSIQASVPEGKMDESYAKSYERASELLAQIESRSTLSSFQDNKENHSANSGVFSFTPYKIPSRNILRSPQTQPTRDNRYASYSWQTIQTPPILSGKLLVSPFTQPRTDPRLSDTGNWRKGTHRNVPVSHVPRRLQFGNPAESDFVVQPISVNPFTRLDENGLNSASYKAKKSWADIVEEEEEEEKELKENKSQFPAEVDVPTQQFSARRSLEFPTQVKKRLNVFKVLAPENPKA